MPEPIYDVPLYKLSQVACFNIGIGLDFRPLSEIICSDEYELSLPCSLR